MQDPVHEHDPESTHDQTQDQTLGHDSAAPQDKHSENDSTATQVQSVEHDSAATQESAQAQTLTEAEKVLEEVDGEIKNGDQLHDSLQYLAAINTFIDALRKLGSDKFKVGTEEFKKMLSLKNVLLNKISSCYISLDDYVQGLNFAKRVTNSDSENLEALAKRVICEERLGEFRAA
eukprot:CAMPEP_0176428100 /NCGR_PEP_ID=MMETSP0127-20121128/12959_1 /TAXON_ID=938130 /ORGANISM="Platyophrya macrostoma, Strain WH" /LENGTH=175 /DNA_ID=CAMNT_0017809739 /DNA_START=12 /DNA_END=535 /DNA_ORIENTATION=+